MTRPGRRRGQALVEFALVFPIFAMLLFALIAFGLWAFYQQQLSNAAREAARYAAIHSSSAQCPTVSHIDPQAPPTTYYRCDRPEDGWPNMVAAGRSAIWGMSPSTVSIVACWSGHVDGSGNDAPPGAPGATYAPCTIAGNVAETSVGGLACPLTAGDTVDTASDVSYANGNSYQTRVTVYACFNWQPPMAGFLLIPSTVTIRAGLTEIVQRQQ
ncbi:MAG: pilus assembly protein [Chloroflexi bacterium]|nr:pilus assembly protein [Chloroflexota bacterium]MDA8236998.1 pilus assembly protein [Chloroflexota bacterium]